MYTAASTVNMYQKTAARSKVRHFGIPGIGQLENIGKHHSKKHHSKKRKQENIEKR